MTEPDPAALEALILAGVSDVVASKLAGSCDSAAVVGWCAYVETAKGVEDPPALIVARLKAGVPPPEPKSDRPPVQTGGFVNGEPPERKPKPEPTEAERIWTAAQGELSGSLSPDTWESVIRPLEAVELNDGTLTLTGTLAAVEWARLRLAGQIQQAVEAATGRPVNVEFIVTNLAEVNQ